MFTYILKFQFQRLREKIDLKCHVNVLSEWENNMNNGISVPDCPSHVFMEGTRGYKKFGSPNT